MLHRSKLVSAVVLLLAGIALQFGCSATTAEQDVAGRYSKGSVLVYFWGTTCRACKIQDREIALFKEQSSLPVEKVQPSQSTIKKYNMTHYPTLILFENGREVRRFVGIQHSDQLISNLKQSLPPQYF